MANTGMVKQGGTAIAREGFGSREVEQRHETASTAVAAAARAEIEAMYIMAMQRPRDWLTVREAILKECSRTKFAGRAYYSIERWTDNKPGRITGEKNRVEGLSVRFADAAIRLAGNILRRARTTYDDETKRQVTVTCIDLETNAIAAKDITINKVVERQKVKEGQELLGERLNSNGKKVFVVRASDDEVLQKEGSLISKTYRTLSLSLVPPDILEEAEEQIFATIKSEVEQDPTAAVKAIVDAFAKLGVKPADLKAYLGHDVDACAPGEIIGLRGLYSAVADGEVVWADALAAKTGKGDVDEKTASTVTEKVKARAAKMAEAQEKKKAKKEKSAPAAKADASPPKREVSLKCPGECGGEEVDLAKGGEIVNGVAWHQHCISTARAAEAAAEKAERQPGED